MNASRALFTVIVLASSAAAQPSRILQQPQSQTVVEGSQVELNTRLVCCEPVSDVQWLQNGNEIPCGVRPSSDLVLTLSPLLLQSGGEYSCRVTFADGFIETTQPAILTVLPAGTTAALVPGPELPTPGSPLFVGLRRIGASGTDLRLIVAMNNPPNVRVYRVSPGGELTQTGAFPLNDAPTSLRGNVVAAGAAGYYTVNLPNLSLEPGGRGVGGTFCEDAVILGDTESSLWHTGKGGPLDVELQSRLGGGSGSSCSTFDPRDDLYTTFPTSRRLVGGRTISYLSHGSPEFVYEGHSSGISIYSFNPGAYEDLGPDGGSSDGWQLCYWWNSPGYFPSSIQFNRPVADLAARDFNGDGAEDVGVATSDPPLLRLFYSHAAGPAAQVALAGSPTRMYAGDLNLDDWPDMAVSSAEQDSIAILFGNRRGDACPPTVLTLPAGADPTGISAGDINLDGWPDLVVALPGRDSLQIYWGGAGPVSPCINECTATAYNDCNHNGVADRCDIISGTSTDHNANGIPDDCEDEDADGVPNSLDPCLGDCGCRLDAPVADLLPLCTSMSGTFYLAGLVRVTNHTVVDLLGEGLGLASVFTGGGGGFRPVSLRYLTRQDFNTYAMTLSGIGSGIIAPPVPSAGKLRTHRYAGYPLYSNAVVRASNETYFALNYGFQAQWYLPSEFDLPPGASDVALTQRTVAALLQRSPTDRVTVGRFDCASSTHPDLQWSATLPGQASRIEVIRGSGSHRPVYEDVVVLEPDLQQVRHLLDDVPDCDNSAFTMSPGGVFPTGGPPGELVVADFNRDNKDDFAVTNTTGRQIRVRYGPRFDTGVDLPTCSAVHDLVVGDWNNDDYPDLAAAQPQANSIVFYVNDQLNGFCPAGVVQLPAGSNPRDLAAMDLNGDQNDDLVLFNSGSNTLATILRGPAVLELACGGSPGDCDSDGSPDFCEADADGDGTPDDCQESPAGDMNCDGALTVSDIAGFVLAVTSWFNGCEAYSQVFPNCRCLNADISGDGAVTVGDIGPFVSLLTGS